MEQLLDLKDKQLEQDFKSVVHDIEEGFTEEDEYIIHDLNVVLAQLDEEDQRKAKRFINIKFKNRQFLELGKFIINEQELELKQMNADENFKDLYQQYKFNNNHEQLVNMIKYQGFCDQNLISSHIQQNIATLAKLGNNIFKVISINDNLFSTDKIHQFELLKILLELIYDGIDNQEEQNKIEHVIGSLLIDQIDQFDFYLENIQQYNPELFLEYIQYVQNLQMKVKCKENDEKKFQQQDLKFLSSLFAADIKQNRVNLNHFLSVALHIPCSQLTYENIFNELQTFQLNEPNIQYCYFQVVWYLWTQFVLQTDFLKDFLILEGKRDKQDDQKKIQVLYQRFVTTQKKSKPGDRVYEYFIDKAICITFQANKSEGYQKFKDKQTLLFSQQKEFYLDIKSYQDLIFLSETRFSELWAITQKQQWGSLLLEQLQCQIFKKIIQFMWSNNFENTFQKFFKIIIQVKRLPFDLTASIVASYFSSQSFFFKVSLICIMSKIKELSRVQIQSLIKYYRKTNSFEGGEQIIYFGELLVKRERTLNDIKSFSKINVSQRLVSIVFFENQILINFIKEVFDLYFKEITKKRKYCLILLTQIFPHVLIEKNPELLCFKNLTSVMNHSDLHKIFDENNQEQIPEFNSVLETLALLYKIYDKLLKDEQAREQVFFNLSFYLKHKFYHFELIYNLKIKNVSNGLIDQIIEAFYQHQIGQLNKLNECCEKIFNQDEKIYQACYESEKYFEILNLTPKFLNVQQLSKLYPYDMKIKLERFNISLAEIKQDCYQTLIEEWINKTNDREKFLNLIPIFFNIIKRGENPSYLLDLIDLKKPMSCKEHFNMKTLFQLLYNNSNEELKVMLLKFRSKTHSVPLIFKNLAGKQESENSLFGINHLLFYIFPQSYTIINFSLSKSCNQIGKTYLINQIFYEEARPFQLSDTSELNKNTIDVMFDFCFNGSRELTIADSHGWIPPQILQRILQLFQLWIIQMDTEEELEQTFIGIQNFQYIIETQKPQICFIIRDSQKELQQKYQGLIANIMKQQIQIHFMQNLFKKNLNEQMQKNEINNAQKFIMDKLKNTIQQGNKISKNQFLTIIENYEQDFIAISKRMMEEEKLLRDIEKEMQYFITQEDGFYNQKAFPLRGQTRLKSEFRNKVVYQQNSVLNDQQDNENNENYSKITIDGKTKILVLFCQIFEQENFYILYLQLVDKIRKFNEEQSKELQGAYQQLVENITKKKKEKSSCQKDNPEIEKIKGEIDKLKQDCSDVQQNIYLKNIGIEIFWREIISQEETIKPCQLNINSAEIFFKLIEKGEPLEFLDGDELKINQKFLQMIFQQFEKKGQERILVLSVLGPQSSGKSTILNKIFGCHFWTSVGRCTKGIYLQLLKVHNKELFENQFDYIMLLDTEGLQSPNQQNADFDKSIALFTLLISDIVIINVKGDITQQFKNLVEMCIYTLGQMATNFQSVKQLSWCFNQNNDTNNLNPFLSQIKDISDNLTKDINKDENIDSKIDYGEILQINKTNIKILGFSSIEKQWIRGQNEGLKECKQLISNESFSADAYTYGIQVIQSFVRKFKSQKEQDQLSDINKFVSNISGNWESIHRLPDLLEFTELIQQQQNKIMRQEYEKIKEDLEQDLNFENQIRRELEKEIGDNQSIKSDQYFIDLKDKCEKKYFLRIEQEFGISEQKLQDFRQNHKISKKVTQKFRKQLEQFISGKKNDCKACIFDIIQEKEISQQKAQRIYQINQLAFQIIQDHNKLENFQNNPENIQLEFENIWSQTIKEGELQHNQIFEEFQLNQYELIMSVNTGYQLATEFAEDYKSLFMTFNKNIPCSQSEKENIFSNFSKELQKQQFVALEKNQKNNRYLDVFQSEATRKLQIATASDLVDIRKFYQYQVELKYFSQNQISQYLKQQFFSDLNNMFLKRSKQERDTWFYEFFILLNILDAQYNKELLEQLLDSFKNQKTSTGKQETYQAFYNSIKYGKQTKVQVTNAEFLLKSKEFYPQLMLNVQIQKKSYESEGKYLDYKEELLNNNIIFWETIEIIPINPEEEFFKYILMAKQLDQSKIFLQCPDQFTKLMEKNDGWKQLYWRIYDFIEEQSNYNISKILVNNDSIQSEDEISFFNDNFLKNIMKNIEKEVANYNLQFSNYGVILNPIGERCIYYYSLLIIWRFGCFKKWQLLDRHQKQINNDKQDLFQKFKNMILGNKKNQSKLQAQKLVQTIYKEIENHFLLKYKVLYQELINSKRLGSFNLIKQLDQEFLQLNLREVNINENEKKKQELIDYIKDQLKFIQNYAQKYTLNLKKQLQSKIVNNNIIIKQEIVKIIQSILENAKLILQKIEQEQLEIKDYFQCEGVNKSDEDYEFQLYQIVFDSLQGQKLPDTKDLKKENQIIFQQKFQKISIQISDATIQSEQKISQFKSFMQELCSYLQLQQTKENFSFGLNQFNLTKDLETMNLLMIGCIFQCPSCNRKCDLQTHDQSQTHVCRNGHQLRGMNQVVFDFIPSLFTCEEMSKDRLIIDQQSNNVCKWSDFQKRYPEWDFQNIQHVNHPNREKFRKIWNGGIGRLLCDYMKQKMQKPVYFREKHSTYQSEEFNHYIFAIDSSNKISSKQYDDAEKAVKDFVKTIIENDHQKAKFSIITFDESAKIRIDFKSAKDSKKSFSYIWRRSGKLELNHAFKELNARVLQFQKYEFSRIIFFLYTTGSVSYPNDAIENFSKINQELRSLVTVIIGSEDNKSATLNQIVNEFRKNNLCSESHLLHHINMAQNLQDILFYKKCIC